MRSISTIFCGYGLRHVDHGELLLGPEKKAKDHQRTQGLQDDQHQQHPLSGDGQGGTTGEGEVIVQLNTPDGASNGMEDGPSKSEQNGSQEGIVEPDSGGTPDLDLSETHVSGNDLRRGSSTDLGSMSATDPNVSMSSSSVEHDHSVLGNDDNNVQQDNQHRVQPNSAQSKQATTTAIVLRRTPDFIPVPGPRIEALPGIPLKVTQLPFDAWTSFEAGKLVTNGARLDAVSQLQVDIRRSWQKNWASTPDTTERHCWMHSIPLPIQR